MCATLTTVLLSAAGCGSSDVAATDGETVVVPTSQSAAEAALGLPRMRPSPSRVALATDRPVTVVVRVVYSGTLPTDTTIQVRSFAAGCGDSFVDTAVVRAGNSVSGALVWVERATALRGANVMEHRPTIALELCRLLPRVQLAAPGSTVMLVMRDSLAQSLVVVPSSPSVPVDTVPFTMDGQLIPLQRRADSSGVVAVYATGLPWARAFIGIAPAGSAALSDATGAAQFTLDGRATTAAFRAWHPSLGQAAATVAFTAAKSTYDVTLTFRR
jgi:hypothetical protein